MNSYEKKAKYADIIWNEPFSDQIEFLKITKQKFFSDQEIKVLIGACGSGRLLFPFLQKIRFKEALAFDLSTDMVNYALQKNNSNKISIKKYDLRKFNTSVKYDMFICMYTSFNYLLRDEDIISSLKSIKRSLKTGGIVVLDLSNLFDFALIGDPIRVKTFKDYGVEITQIMKFDYDSKREIWNHYETLFVDQGHSIEKIEEKHKLRYTSISHMKLLCNYANLKLIEVKLGYKDTNQHRLIFILES